LEKPAEDFNGSLAPRLLSTACIAFGVTLDKSTISPGVYVYSLVGCNILFAVVVTVKRPLDLSGAGRCSISFLDC
jgi:hypothetical protein